MSKTILVVDDEKKIVNVLRTYLERGGYRVEVAYEGQQALTAFRHEKPSLVLLDLNLPGIDGLDVARTMRQESSVPIIMLTARVEETDRLVGLELGADDYIVKPFSPREVVARVRTVLRRTNGEIAPIDVLRSGAITLDLANHCAMVNGEPAELTPTEFNLLAAMMRRPGRAFTRLDLLDRVLGETYDGYDRTIDAHIKNLRQKIGDDPKQPRYIVTVFGVGYKFTEEE